jgi:two-component system phosphate regulon response regulator OmpR
MDPLILHVDDEADIRELLAATLKDFGYRVTSAADATEAMRALKAEPPRLVIIDLQLAQGDGIELARTLKARLPGTPVMMLTGVIVDAAVAQKSLGGLVDAYVSKTTPLAGVLAEIERLLGGR